jgi:uncharacterized protein (DUF1330 family)
MHVANAVEPVPGQIVQLLNAGISGPIIMVNLLKFRDFAVYEDGKDGELSGRDAYYRYAEGVRRLVEAGGGRILITAAANTLVLGEVEEMWDAVALVEYASPQAFVQMAMSPDMGRIAHHRKAGLKGQLLIACTPMAAPA